MHKIKRGVVKPGIVHHLILAVSPAPSHLRTILLTREILILPQQNSPLPSSGSGSRSLPFALPPSSILRNATLNICLYRTSQSMNLIKISFLCSCSAFTTIQYHHGATNYILSTLLSLPPPVTRLQIKSKRFVFIWQVLCTIKQFYYFYDPYSRFQYRQ